MHSEILAKRLLISDLRSNKEQTPLASLRYQPAVSRHCGGVKAALEGRQLGLVDYWVRAIRDVYYTHKEFIDGIGNPVEQLNQLCELNVKQQVANVSHTNIIQNAWKRGQELTIHGWIYGIHDGRVRNLMEPISSIDQVPEQYRVY